MRRYLFAALSALSLMLFAATCVMWVRSCCLTETFTGAQTSIGSGWGEVLYLHLEASPAARRPIHAASFSFSHKTGPANGNVTEYTPRGSVGHDWGRFRYGSLTSVMWWVRAPWWSLGLASGLVAAGCVTGWVRARRAVRFSRGLCLACGYDLRETPGRCPECGRVTKPADPQVSGRG